MAIGVATVSRPSAQEVRAAISHPDSGLVQMGWDGFSLNWHSSPPGHTTAYRTTAVARRRYVANLDAELDAAYAFDPIGRLGQDTAYAVTFGLANVAALRAEFGYLPGILRAPDSEGPVTFSPHGVVVLLGHFGTSATTELETWSCSTSHDVVGPDIGAMPVTIGATALEAIFDAWAAQISSASLGSYSTEVWLDGIAYYRRLGNGKADGGQWERFLSPDPVSGIASAAGAFKAYQLASVVTEDAMGPRKGRFGRFYLPAPAQPLTAGVLPADVAASLVANAATALAATNDALNTAVGDPTELIVASSIGDGENRPVRELRVGRVLDTQRRRRRDLSEDYAVVPFQV